MAEHSKMKKQSITEIYRKQGGLMGKADVLSSIPGKHTVERKNWVLSLSSDPHTNAVACAYLHACAENKLKYNKTSF